MAVKDSTISNNGITQTTSWSVDTGDTGAGSSSGGIKNSAQVVGTFSGTTVTMQGSNDGTNWVDLHDESVPANLCSFTANGLKGILETCKYYRPSAASGTGVGLQVTMFGKK